MPRKENIKRLVKSRNIINLNYFCFQRRLEFSTQPSDTKLPKRRRKIIVVKKAPINASNTSAFETRGTRHQKGSKVFVKRVRKLREPRKAQTNVKNKEATFSTSSSLFDDIRKQLVFKSSGYVFSCREKNCFRFFQLSG